MANITAEHLQHMARRHHATMQKLDSFRERIATYSQKGFGLLETGFGSWAGGLLEGRSGGAAIGPIPLNLGIGIAMVAAGAIVGGGKEEVTVTREVTANFERVTARRNSLGEHLSNLGNGFVGSYLAATGYAFGKRWRETGKILGGGGHPWTQPYENGWPKGQVTADAATSPPPVPPAPPTAGWYQ